MNSIFNPDERLRIFISSAQNNENGFAWKELRKRIKEYLKKCPYLNPFIIEDVGSCTPSTQFFKRQVERSDIVVLLVKGELRDGTSIEYALSKELKKPMLIYFLHDDNPNSQVKNLRNDIEANDYCTYHEVNDINSIEMNIYKHIIEDVIRSFQDTYYYQKNLQTELVNFNENNEDLEQSKLSTPNKTIISMFGGSYSYIFELLEINFRKSIIENKNYTLDNLGRIMLEWLLLGKFVDCSDDILLLINKCKDIYSNTGWLIKRWNAIIYQIKGDISNALQCEQQALELAKKYNMPKWIIDDILIDCRNMEIQLHQLKGEILIEGEAQKQLNKSDIVVYLPVVDRYLTNVYNEIEKDEFRINTASRHTILSGNSMYNVINNVENYFFSAMLYGSYTHLLLTRKILAFVFKKYSYITNSKKLMFESIKLYILQSNVKDFKLFIKEQWDIVYSFIGSYADEMWELAKKAPIINQDEMKQAVIETIGMYLSDKVFLEAEEFLIERGAKIYWRIADDYFECIMKNISRLNQNKIVVVISKIISGKRFSLGNKITNLVQSLDIDKLNIENQIILKNSLVKQWSFILETNGDPQIISILVNCNRECFEELEKLENNGLVGAEKNLYSINTGSKDWKPILIDQINSARIQFDSNGKNGVYAMFADNPYELISTIIRKNDKSPDKDIIKILYNEFIPLSVEILNSNSTIHMKDNCASCLCDVLLLFRKQNIEITEDIIKVIQSINLFNGSEFLSFRSKDTLTLRIFMIKLIVGLVNKEELLIWGVEYNKKTVNERCVLAECIEKYLFYHEKERANIDPMIMSIALQCFEDDEYEIRCIACQIFSYLSAGKQKQFIEDLLYQATTDPSHFVRSKILYLCREKFFNDDISKELLNILSKDANYAIRKYALETISEYINCDKLSQLIH